VAEEIKALLPRARCRQNPFNDSSEIGVGVRLDDGSPANGIGGAGAREQVADTKGIRSNIVFGRDQKAPLSRLIMDKKGCTINRGAE